MSQKSMRATLSCEMDTFHIWGIKSNY